MIINYNKLKIILNTKNDIKSALIEKKIISEDDNIFFEEYADKIRNSKTSNQITEFNGEMTFSSFKDAENLNDVSVIGALLWRSESDGSLKVTNGISTEPDYWDPRSSTITTPSKEGYVLIGVCVGYRKFAYVSWNGLTNSYKWADTNETNSNTVYLMHPSMIHGNGYENTQHILNTHDSDITSGTIWYEIRSEINNENIPLYLPSRYELLECRDNICDNIHDETKDGKAAFLNCSFNRNLAKLLNCSSGYSYISSSQTCSSYGHNLSVSFSDGQSYSISKSSSSTNRSIALIHFG